jgi:S-adenosylmethionine:tRNA ribosyltransferase-isomerase
MRKFPGNINIDDYDYELPEERIAQYPAKERDKSQLLVYRNGEISKDIFRNICDHLPKDSLLVFNNTRVIRARLLFRKTTGAHIEILCLEPLSPAGYEQSFSSGVPVEWKCIIGNLKKWKGATISSEFTYKNKRYNLTALRLNPEGEAWRVRFRWEPDEISFGNVIESAGHIPLPPYVRREDEEEDYIRYQTVYGRINGSVAAPTAGLHFTDKILRNIINKGIKSVNVTLHVGGGTFQPVREHDIYRHDMHCEHFFVGRETIEALLANYGRIIAVGTTSVRTLESLYWLGVKLFYNPSAADSDYFTDQWEPYLSGQKLSAEDSLESLLSVMRDKQMTFLSATTKIMIIPGYKYRIADGMITNFHQPGSTLLLLVSAWTGDDWKKIYNFALGNNFRFLSYGDGSLLIR